MALETKPAKDPAAEDKHELDPKRKAALDTALAQVEKSFGKGSAMRLGDQPEQNVEVIPTGSLALDMALGIGGLPKGRIVEIYGPESSGKTTLALHVVANAQKKGGVSGVLWRVVWRRIKSVRAWYVRERARKRCLSIAVFTMTNKRASLINRYQIFL